MHAFHKPTPDSWSKFKDSQEYKTLAKYTKDKGALSQPCSALNLKKFMLGTWIETNIKANWGNFDKIKIILEVAHKINAEIEQEIINKTDRHEISDKEHQPNVLDVCKLTSQFPMQLDERLRMRIEGADVEAKQKPSELKKTKTGYFTSSDLSGHIISLLNKINVEFKDTGLELDQPTASRGLQHKSKPDADS